MVIPTKNRRNIGGIIVGEPGVFSMAYFRPLSFDEIKCEEIVIMKKKFTSVIFTKFIED